MLRNMSTSAGSDLENSVFWENATGGLLNHPDFFDTIASGVRVYCGDILCVKKDLIRLTSGEEISADAILCGTGW
jgi:hypothetical protein